jgi:predicted amidohydrolase
MHWLVPNSSSCRQAFTKTTGEAHWDTLLRARAIENGCFVAAAGQCGVTREGRETYGTFGGLRPLGPLLG